MPALQRPVRNDEAVVETAPAARRVLDEAERLFAELGYNGVSIRMIATAADANISSVYYHFSSKRDLLEAVCRRRMAPLIRERAALMAACLAEAGQRGPDVERLVAAFVAPVIRKAMSADAEAGTFRKFAGYLPTDPSAEVRAVMNRIYDDSVRAFVDGLRAVYSAHERNAFAWGLICSFGALLYAQTDAERIRAILGVSPDAADAEEVVRLVTRYIVGGMNNLAAAPRA
jgi:AcrR family transcriptional regulator